MSAWDRIPFASALSLSDISVSAFSNTDERSIVASTEKARDAGYDFLCVPLTTDAWRDRWRAMCVLPTASQLSDSGGEATEKDGDGDARMSSGPEGAKMRAAEARAEAWRAAPAFGAGEVTLVHLDEAQNVLVSVSDWLELDAADPWVRHDAEIALLQELSYASYLDVQTAILPPPRNRQHVASYARALNAALVRIPYMQLSIRLPIYDPSIFRDENTPSGERPGSKASEAELNMCWEMWDAVRTLCGYNPRLTLALDLTPPLPSVPGVLSRWAAEPIRHVFLPASTFISNAKGYPVLPRALKTFLQDLMKHRPTIVLARTAERLHAKGTEAGYMQYVQHLEKTAPGLVAAATEGTVENFARGYADYLQAPLQPLMDNLQSTTYNTFEQDPVKYERYEEAMYLALAEWPPSDKPLVLIVAGAGRGPLVARALKAVDRAKREVTVYALEKNPNAFVTLQNRKRTEWRDRVLLIFGDMRQARIPEQADIVVSELLGSFGDNELSPECLDGAMRFLKPGGISIPASYTAHLSPISSSKLYNEVNAGKDPQKSSETPYVVMFQAINVLSGDEGGAGGRCGPRIQECWEFEHPRRDGVLGEDGLPLTNSHNARAASLTFHIPHAGTMHGLAGYFESVLYGPVGLSIHPERQADVSPNMLSWFPIFFPLSAPLYLPSGAELRVNIWRLTENRKVWYEWAAEAFLPVFHPAVPPALPPSVSSRASAVPPSPSSPWFNVDGAGSVHVSSPLNAPSPLIDAIDNPFLSERVATPRSGHRLSRGVSGEDSAGSEAGVVKVGQTALHNPRGRSSWIGL
ncbi:PRMT5-domain-containing protein [Peniophora sp. CONT]|nr:PRMT5-domain-containing protein [Peniophora sp. CONT]